MKTKICTKCLRYKLANTDNFCEETRNGDGLQSKCKKCDSKGKREHRIKHGSTCRLYDKNRGYNLKLKIISHYGGCCIWPGCEIIEPAFLTGDHINNNGVEHRNILNKHMMYKWLVRNNFPPDIQILCWNHQHLKQLEVYEIKRKYTKQAIQNRKSLLKLRLLVISHYGGKCACCGETNIDLLTIDHICGGGRKHLKEIGERGIYRWLKRNNFPPGYQVLCHNCNSGRSVNGGVCPHKEK